MGPNCAKSTTGIAGSPPCPAPGAPRAAPGAARDVFTKALMSSWVTRPLKPPPCTRVRSTPSSRANLRTEGLACAREKPGSFTGGRDPATGAGAAASPADAAGDGFESGCRASRLAGSAAFAVCDPFCAGCVADFSAVLRAAVGPAGGEPVAAEPAPGAPGAGAAPLAGFAAGPDCLLRSVSEPSVWAAPPPADLAAGFPAVADLTVATRSPVDTVP